MRFCPNLCEPIIILCVKTCGSFQQNQRSNGLIENPDLHLTFFSSSFQQRLLTYIFNFFLSTNFNEIIKKKKNIFKPFITFSKFSVQDGRANLVLSSKLSSRVPPLKGNSLCKTSECTTVYIPSIQTVFSCLFSLFSSIQN